MSKDFEAISQNISVIEALQVMRDKSVGWLVVVTPNHHLQGIVSASDIIRTLDNDISSPKLLQGLVKDIMIHPDDIAYVDDNDVMAVAIRKLAHRNLRAIVVMKGLECIGVLDQLTIINWWLQEVVSTIPPTAG